MWLVVCSRGSKVRAELQSCLPSSRGRWGEGTAETVDWAGGWWVKRRRLESERWRVGWRGDVTMAMTSLVFQSPSVAPHCNMAARSWCYVCVLVVISGVSSASSRVLVVLRCTRGRVCVRVSSLTEPGAAIFPHRRLYFYHPKQQYRSANM